MKKEEVIKSFLAEPLKVGDIILVQGLGSQDKKSWHSSAKVEEIIDGVPYIKSYGKNKPVTEDWKKVTMHLGANPFPKTNDRVQSINFELASIIHQLYKEDSYEIEGTPIKASSDNPFVFVNGIKQYYQRPLVWNLEDKQLLLESIYQGVDCGKVLVRNRGWEELRVLQADGHELAWKDIVDGKQRMNAIKTFIDGEYPDKYGNYYEDLSDLAQRKLKGHQLFSYAELPDNTSDEEVIRQFLRLNFTGVPQSKEHIEFIKSLL